MATSAPVHIQSRLAQPYGDAPTELWAIAGTRCGRASIRRPGEVRVVSEDHIRERIVPEPVSPTRLAREQIAELPHPVACPDCGDHGAYLRTMSGWDRIWCPSCSNVWEVQATVIDGFGLSTCLECQTAYVEEGNVYCEECWTSREAGR